MAASDPMTAQPLTTAIVVDTAAGIADAEGFDAVSLARVARELGTSQPALYRHVDGIDGLVRSLGLRGRVILADRLLQAAVGRSADDAVRAMGLAWRRMVQDHPGVYAATDRYPCAGDPELEAAVGRVVGVLGEALVGFGLDEADRVHAGRALRSAFHGFSHLESGDGHPLDVDLDESFDQLIGLLCAGIRSLASAGAATG